MLDEGFDRSARDPSDGLPEIRVNPDTGVVVVNGQRKRYPRNMPFRVCAQVANAVDMRVDSYNPLVSSKGVPHAAALGLSMVQKVKSAGAEIEPVSRRLGRRCAIILSAMGTKVEGSLGVLKSTCVPLMQCPPVGQPTRSRYMTSLLPLSMLAQLVERDPCSGESQVTGKGVCCLVAACCGCCFVMGSKK